MAARTKLAVLLSAASAQSVALDYVIDTSSTNTLEIVGPVGMFLSADEKRKLQWSLKSTSSEEELAHVKVGYASSAFFNNLQTMKELHCKHSANGNVLEIVNQNGVVTVGDQLSVVDASLPTAEVTLPFSGAIFAVFFDCRSESATRKEFTIKGELKVLHDHGYIEEDKELVQATEVILLVAALASLVCLWFYRVTPEKIALYCLFLCLCCFIFEIGVVNRLLWGQLNLMATSSPVTQNINAAARFGRRFGLLSCMLIMAEFGKPVWPSVICGFLLTLVALYRYVTCLPHVLNSEFQFTNSPSHEDDECTQIPYVSFMLSVLLFFGHFLVMKMYKSDQISELISESTQRKRTCSLCVLMFAMAVFLIRFFFESLMGDMSSVRVDLLFVFDTIMDKYAEDIFTLLITLSLVSSMQGEDSKMYGRLDGGDVIGNIELGAMDDDLEKIVENYDPDDLVEPRSRVLE